MNSSTNNSVDHKHDSFKQTQQMVAPATQSKSSTQASNGGLSSPNQQSMTRQSLNQTQTTSSQPNPVPQPEKKSSQMSALDRLKQIQNNFKQSWKGIKCDFSGRPGTSNFVNSKRIIKTNETSIQEEERQNQLCKCFNKLKELDEESRSSPVNNFVNNNRTQNKFTANQTVKQQTSNLPELVTFKNITEKQMVTTSVNLQGYQKSSQFESNELLYKMQRFDNKLIRSMLENRGFIATESHEWNILWGSSSCKSYIYEGLNEFQKINHFPQSHEITRKDRLCFNIVHMQEKYGKQHFDFVPDTYILPDEFGEFYEHYQKLKQHDSKKNIWIIKPANAAQGRGISIVDDINDVNVDELSVISRYVTNPLLINGHKFDLRIYVLITSYEPLRIYIFQEGLARFASETYTSKINKNNKYMHLTNYSINKNNENFIQNENCEADDYGYKWSLGAFCHHLEQVGIDMNLLWSRTYDVIIKTILSGENFIQNAMKKNGTHRTNCFEILGFDVLIDSDLKPWLLEVNLSPSLACDAPLDLSIKSNLVCDAFNLAGIKKFDRKKESLNKIKQRMKVIQNKGKKPFGQDSSVAGMQLNGMMAGNDIYNGQSNHQLQQIIESFVNENPLENSPFLEPLKRAANVKYKDYVRETLQENQRRGNFIRIYPARGSEMYDMFFHQQRPYNKIVQKILFSEEILKNYGKTSYIPDQISEIKPEKSQLKDKSYHDNDRKAIEDERNKFQKPPLKEEFVKPGNTSGIRERDQFTPSIPQVAQTQLSDVASSQQVKESNYNLQEQSTEKATSQEKVLITGDDILIEYVSRLMNLINQINDDQLFQEQWLISIDKFITHYVWHASDQKKANNLLNSMLERLEGRLKEMQERRRRLIKYLYKKEGKLEEFEEGYQQSINKKNSIIKKFPSLQLEELLRTSTKNVAQEVVSCLIPPSGGLGVLTQIEQFFSKYQESRNDNVESFPQHHPNENKMSMTSEQQNKKMVGTSQIILQNKQRLNSASINKRMLPGFPKEQTDNFMEHNGPINSQSQNHLGKFNHKSLQGFQQGVGQQNAMRSTMYDGNQVLHSKSPKVIRPVLLKHNGSLKNYF